MRLNYTIENFRDSLKKAIYESSINSNRQEEIINKISKRGYRLGFISGVFEGNIMLDTLSLIDLGVFAYEIYKEADIGYIDPSIFLEDIEMEKVKGYRAEFKQDLFEHPVVFEDVRQVSNDIWTVVVSAEFIAKLGNSNMLNYEFETQREARVIQGEDGIILTPTVNWESVEQITDSLLKDTFIPNTLTFNLPLKHSENFKFDKRHNRLILLEGKLDIIDGYHRYLGITSAIRQKNIDYNFEVRITNFDVDKARQFIIQEDKRNPISKEYIKSIDEGDWITGIVNRLNQNNRSELKGLITTDISTITTGFSLVSFELMYKTIDRLWKPQTISESNKIFDYLRDYFNELVGLYPQELKTNINETKRINKINDERMFIVYLVIAKKLELIDNWDKRLPTIIDDVTSEKFLDKFLDTHTSVMKRQINKVVNTIIDMVGVL